MTTLPQGRADVPTPGAAAPGAGPVDPRLGPGTAPRQWVVQLPAGLELLNSNHRGHWRRNHAITAELRLAGAWMARAGRVPPLRRAHITGVYEPPDRRKRDPANLYPSFKAAVDGLVDAGVLVDDDAAHLDGPDMRLGDTCPRGRLVLIITEAAP